MFNWLTNWFTGRDSLQTTAPHIQAVAQRHSPLAYDDSHIGNMHLYQRSSWVYMAVNRIAEAGALVPLRVLQLQGEKRIEVDNHPLEMLLHNPNPTTSRFELLEQTLGYLELTGNAYWFLVGDRRGQPAQIWVLRPDRVTIVPDKENFVRGYLYEVNGQHIPMDAIEVVHFKRWHPQNEYYGLSALEAARLSVRSDLAMARWNESTFGQDAGVPAGIVNVKEFINDTDFDRLKHEWKASYGGGQRRTAFMRGGAVEWQNIGMSHTDLDFLKGRQAHRDEILNIFGIPVGLVSDNATEANAKVAERQFIERTLYPKLVRLAQKITQELLPFYGGNQIAVFDDIRPTDIQTRLAEIETARQVMSINEIRQTYYNLQPVAWGDLPTVSEPIAALPEPEIDPQKAIDNELAQWERFALNRVGKSEMRPFEVEHILDEMAFEISAGLLFAGDKDAIKSVFADVRERAIVVEA